MGTESLELPTNLAKAESSFAVPKSYREIVFAQISASAVRAIRNIVGRATAGWNSPTAKHIIRSL